MRYCALTFWEIEGAHKIYNFGPAKAEESKGSGPPKRLAKKPEFSVCAPGVARLRMTMLNRSDRPNGAGHSRMTATEKKSPLLRDRPSERRPKARPEKNPLHTI